MGWGILDWGDGDLLQWQYPEWTLQMPGIIESLLSPFHAPGGLAGALMQGDQAEGMTEVDRTGNKGLLDPGHGTQNEQARTNYGPTGANSSQQFHEENPRRKSFDFGLFGAALADAGDALNGRSGNSVYRLQQMRIQQQQMDQESQFAETRRRSRQQLANYYRQNYPRQPHALMVEAGLTPPAPQQTQPTTAQRNYEFLVQQGLPPEEAMRRAFSSGVQVNVGQQGPKLPSNYMWRDPGNPQAGVQPIPGGPATQPTQGEREAAAFAEQQKAASQRIADLEAQGITAPNLVDDVTSQIPVVGNFLVGAGGQQYKAAAIDWLLTNLRDESGAAIGIEEAEQQWRRYFPVPGDSQNTIEQKRQARAAAEQAAKTRAGRAGVSQVGDSVDFAKGSPIAATETTFAADGKASTNVVPGYRQRGDGTSEEDVSDPKAPTSAPVRRFRFDPATGKLIPR